jgi:DNA-binding transcriptional LysR family regulator
MQKQHLAAFNAFIAVAEQKNFTRAAARLGISTGSLSETIKHLEKDLGVRLLNRTTRSVAPTEAGERLLTRLRPLISEFDSLLDSINEFRDRPAGSLRIIVPPIVATCVIAPLLPRFTSEYPDIRLEIVVSNKPTDIVAERFDAGVRLGEKLEHDMIAFRISGHLEPALAASPRYLAAHPAPQTPDDLLRHRCIRYRLASDMLLPWKFIVDGKPVELDVPATLTVNDPHLANAAAVDGIGVFYGPITRMREPIAQGKLVQLLQEWIPAPSDAFYLFYPSRRQNPAPLQALIEFMKRNAPGANGANDIRRANGAGAANGTEGADGGNGANSAHARKGNDVHAVNGNGANGAALHPALTLGK